MILRQLDKEKYKAKPMLEINPILNQIKDLMQRSGSLRGYL